ncbi:hypothetical protein BJ996_003831 [Streptomyces phaeogriseichromatogenes]|nr:hypothetical protein [Streptomyces murinus]
MALVATLGTSEDHRLSDERLESSSWESQATR